MSIATTTPTTLAQRLQRLSWLAAFAIVGQLLLTASALLLPVWSEYGLIGDNISELAVGRYGLVQTTAFVIAGLGTLGLAFAIRKLTAGSRGSLVGSSLIAVYGAGAVLSAIVQTDPIHGPADISSLSAAATIHSGVALISFISAIVAMFVLTRTFGKDKSWRSIARWSVFFPAGALALMFVQQEGPLIGVLQRLLVAIISAWLILIALKIRSLVTSGK